MVALNFALSFLRIVTLGGKLVRIFMPAYSVLFLKNKIGRYVVCRDSAYSLCLYCV